MWQDLSRAFALVLVIEGLMPLLTPNSWRDMVSRVAGVEDRHLRVFGAVMVLFGLFALRLLHG